MPLVHCPNPTNCEGVENPISNLSAEGPDIAKCFRYSFTPQSTTVCEFDLALCNSFAAVGADVGIFCPPVVPCFEPACGPNPPLPIIYSSNAQSCTVDCGDATSETYEVAPGTFVAMSQAEADADADAFACQLAALQCFGPVTTFTNTPQSCTATCPDQSTVTYTTPAGFFTALSQAEANVNAFLFACDVAALLCASAPPVATYPGAGTQRDNPTQPLYGNFAQSCSSTCPDGSIYTHVIPSGTYSAESRDAANAVARSAACSLANAFRVCLSNLPAGVCVGEFVFEAIDSTGLAAPVSFSVVSGALPNGLGLTSQGFLQGVPTTAGTYNFIIRATGADRNFTQRSYTMVVAGIDNAVLADATENQPYAAALTQTGMSGSITWSISEGVLPAGISLQPFTGVLSGTATESGDFPFTVSISNGAETCSTDLLLTVQPDLQPTEWWPLNEVGPGNRTGSILGTIMSEIANPVGSAAGKISLASRHNPGVGGNQALGTGFVAPIRYQGNGFDCFGWINTVSFDVAAGANAVNVSYSRVSGSLRMFRINLQFDLARMSVETRGDSGVNTNLITPYVFVPGAWIFWRVSYDAATQMFSTQFDNGAVTLGAVKPMTADASANFAMSAVGITAACDILFDEMGIFQEKLSDADASAIYNAGAGRTFP